MAPDDVLRLSPDYCHFPMWVISIADMIEVTGRNGELPCHEDLMAEGKMVKYDPRTMAKCLFLSHTWLRFKHPDSEDGVKKKLINGVLSGIMNGKATFTAYWFAVVAHSMKDVPAKLVQEQYRDGFVWMDWLSIPQVDKSDQLLAIQSIPYYVASTHEFIVLAGPWKHENGSVRDLLAWNNRGWCRMEQVSNALSPRSKPVVCATSVNSIKNFGPCEILGRLWFNEVVGKGAFAVDSDRYALRDVIKGMLDRRAAQAMQQGSLVWYRTLLALETSILAGTGYEDPMAGCTLGEWMARMHFESVHDGAATGYTPLRFAVMAGRVDLVDEILKDPTVDVQAPIRKKHKELMFNFLDGLTILHQACISQHGEVVGAIVERLLARGANPKAQATKEQKWQPMHLAVTSDCRAAIRVLMSHDPELRNGRIVAGLRVFERCAVGGQPETMAWLLEQYSMFIEPTLDQLCTSGMSWCLAATFEENAAEMLQLLIDHGATPNIDDGSWLPKPFKEKPPLRFLVPKILALLWRRSKKPSNILETFANCIGATPLHCVAMQGNLRSLEVLLKAGALLEGRYIHVHFNRATPLHCAAAGGHAIVVERLLEASPAMALEKDKGGKTATYWARRRGYDELGERLSKAEAAAKAAGLGPGGKTKKVAPAPPASVKYRAAAGPE